MSPASNATSNAKPRLWRRLLRLFFRSVERLLAVVGLSFLIYHFFFHYSCITSNSMKPTLQGTSFDNGDQVLTERVSYWFREPRRWEVLTIRRNDGLVVMKRLVALPGEKLQVLPDGMVVINGQEVAPPPELDFLEYIPVVNIFDRKVFDCKDGYYVLGDYTLDSDDSRYNGTISREEILGRAWIILGPEGRRRWITPEGLSGQAARSPSMKRVED